jgi:hypothetical protein
MIDDRSRALPGSDAGRGRPAPGEREVAVMAQDWHHYLKKYIWDDDKTPFLIAVAKLNRRQARSEVFLYALFISVPAALLVASVLAYSLKNGFDALAWAGVYSASVCISAAWLHVSKSPAAAMYSASAPVVILGYLLLQGFHPRLGWLDQVLIVAVLLLWLRYTLRIVAIARRYPAMPEPPHPS